MKEFGDRRATLGVVLCGEKTCNLNNVAFVLEREEAVLLAVDHEIKKNHTVVILDFDKRHPVLAKDAVKALHMTGFRIPEEFISQP